MCLYLQKMTQKNNKQNIKLVPRILSDKRDKSNKLAKNCWLSTYKRSR